jgi:8-oxo-dGTP pyrophosphatase MutT (NUDIX family)
LAHAGFRRADTNKIYSLEATIGLPVINPGGLVCNDDNRILLIFKRGKWDLPKGRVEGDEYQTAALREVKEETA